MFPFLSLSRGPLREKAEDSQGGGGFSAEQMQQLTDLISGQVKTIVTTELNGYDKKQKKELSKLTVPIGEQIKQELFGGMSPKKFLKKLRNSGQEQAADEPEQQQQQPPKPGEKKYKDPLKKKKFLEMEQKIEELLKGKQEAEGKAKKAQIDSALNSALTNLDFVDADHRDLAFGRLRGLIEEDDDGTLLINETPIDKYVAAHIPERYPNLLKKRDVGGAGPTRGSGRAKTYDVDSVPTDPKELAEFSRKVASLM